MIEIEFEAGTADRRLLLVHAHPDDESLDTGATMAHYVATGAAVTLVTCTLGEEGEVLLPALAQLAADHADQLGGWRIAELSAAMAEVGVTDHRFLAGAGRFRDSGMMGHPANANARAFWRADSEPAIFDAAVAALVEVIRDVRPQVAVTYDDAGGYGHPDHIMAHRVTTAAVRGAAAPDFPGVLGKPWPVSKLYWTAMPRSVMAAGLQALKAAGDGPFTSVESVDDLPFVVDDAVITTVIHAGEHSDAKVRALTAHGTQIRVEGPFFALSNNLGMPIVGDEYFRLVSGAAGTSLDAEGRETDLFAGLDLAVTEGAVHRPMSAHRPDAPAQTAQTARIGQTGQGCA